MIVQPDPTRSLHAMVDELYGPLARAPEALTTRLLHRAEVARWGGAALDTWRIAWGEREGDGFTLQLMLPAAPAPCPAIVTGDACWAYLTEDVMVAAAAAGVALAWFNRTEVAADPPSDDAAAIAAILQAPPHGMAALAAWAWAMSRAVDALITMPAIDAQRIAVAGHSRGGKAALLAAALDTRVALVAANNSGTLGAASSFVAGAGSESVADLVRRFPHWVSPQLREIVARGGVPSADQPFLLAAVAPRALLVTQATDDAWANPAGTRHAVERAREAYAASGAERLLRLVERSGGHAQSTADWIAVIGAVRSLRSIASP